MLIGARESNLLVIDMQIRLLPAVDDWQRVLEQVIWMARLARRFEVPILVSEQYPQGLGVTHPDLMAEVPSGVVAAKQDFSCVAARCFDAEVTRDRPQWILCGIESHVCVLQTALELKAAGSEVFVVAEAVSSRRIDDKTLALARMRRHGIDIVSPEMVAFEWMRKAGTPLFREISRDFLR